MPNLIRLSLAVASAGVFITLAMGGTPVAAQNRTAPPAKPAQSKPGDAGQALEIAPPVLTLTANPGETIKAQISLRDVSRTDLIVRNQINDFVAAGEDGTPKILLKDEGSNPYSLKSWITPLPELRLVPKQIKTLPVTIKVPANASPGGYYGVIRFTATPPELKGTGVSLSASLGSLVLVRVKGQAKESLEIASFSVMQGEKEGSVFESTPLKFVERIKNTGNIHVQPSGQVSITDMFGKKVAAVNINLPPRYVLPQSIRKFEQPLDSSVLGNKQLFGRYTAEVSLAYGDKKQHLVTQTVSFWVVPYKFVAAVIVALIAGFFALRYVLGRYKRRIIEQAQKSGKSNNKK